MLCLHIPKGTRKRGLSSCFHSTSQTQINSVNPRSHTEIAPVRFFFFLLPHLGASALASARPARACLHEAHQLHHRAADGLRRGLGAGERHWAQGSGPVVLHHRRGVGSVLELGL